jgi:hypothetical protein
VAAPFRIQRGEPNVTTDIQAHKVARGLIVVAPVFSQGLREKRRQHPLIRRSQRVLFLQQEGGATDGGGPYPGIITAASERSNPVAATSLAAYSGVNSSGAGGARLSSSAALKTEDHNSGAKLTST